MEKPTLNIYVVRHGQNEDNAKGILNGHRDEPLTAKGIDQAVEIADMIKQKGINFDAVYYSPLSRARKTAEIICDALEVNNLETMHSLIERDFGVMSGELAKDIEALCSPAIIKTNTITYFLSAPGAETFQDLFMRASRVIEFIQAKHKSGSILLATHGDMGKMLYAAYYGLEWKNVLTDFHFGNCEMLVLSEEKSRSERRVIGVEQHNH